MVGDRLVGGRLVGQIGRSTASTVSENGNITIFLKPRLFWVIYTCKYTPFEAH